MSRSIRKGPFVYGDPATFGPIGPVFAPDTTSQATLFAAGSGDYGLLQFVRLMNYLRTGFLNANLATVTGAVTAEAQVSGPFVRPLVTTLGSIPAALSAFTSTYVQAEWVALYTMLNVMRTGMLNAGLVTSTGSVIPYTNARHSRYVQQDIHVGGTVAPALTSPGATYTKSEIDKLVACMEQIRLTLVNSGLASDRSQVELVNMTDNSDVALPAGFSKTLVLAGATAGNTVTLKKGSTTDSNGFAITSVVSASAYDVFKIGNENPDNGVVEVTTADNISFVITGKNSGVARVDFVAANGAKTSVFITVAGTSTPASLVLDDDASTFDLSSGPHTQQLGWVVKDAYGYTLAEYTNSATYLTFASDNAHATVSVGGLVTEGTAGVATITATFTRTFSTGPDSAVHNTITLTDTFAATTQA